MLIEYVKGVIREPGRVKIRPGHVAEVSDAEAIRLINSGQAVPVRSQPIERAVVEPPETSAMPALDFEDSEDGDNDC